MLPGGMMTTDEKMTIDDVYKQLHKVRRACEKGNQRQKRQILDHLELVTGHHRKSLIRLLHGPLERHPRRQQRGRTCQADFDDALGLIYQSYERVCA